MSILVTGGAGYIGSHVALAFLDSGYDVLVLDNLSTGIVAAVPDKAYFIEGDCGDRVLLQNTFKNHKIDGIIHMAGSIIVPESVENPLKYYLNNTFVTAILLEETIKAGLDRILFSSTAAVYGFNPLITMKEEYTPAPQSPYAWSKLFSEQIIQDTSKAHGINYVILRYFNVAGCDPQMRTGQHSPNATHLIKVAIDAALAEKKTITINGTDYNTADGTPMRDFIHVSDLAKAHVSAFEYMRKGKGKKIFNCGYGTGYSVKEVIRTVEEISGNKIETVAGARRPGDPIALFADSGLLQKETNWQPEYNSLHTIIKTALEWELRKKAI